jgi:hypothetical protein
MAMNNEAEFYVDGIETDHTPSGALTAGDVVNVQGNQCGIVPTGGIAASKAGSIVVEGIAKVAAVAFAMSAGAVVGWDEDGTPYGGSTTGACTTKLAAADFLMGTLVADVTATAGVAYVRLNKFPKDMAPILSGQTFETVSATKTLDVEDINKVLQVDTDAFVITLPSTADGLRYVIQNIAADGVAIVAISPAAADKISGADLAGTDDHDENNTKATAKTGDWIILRAVAATGWYIEGKRGIWAQA